MNQASVPEKPRPTIRGRFLSPLTLLSFAVAAAFLAFLVTRLDIDLGTIWESFKESNPFFFILAFIIHYTTFIFRGARWRLLLRNAQENTQEPELSTLHCGSLILLGFSINSVTWFHLGDAYRAYAYADDAHGSFSRTVGTIVAEQLHNMAMVFFLLAAATLVLVATGVGTPWLFVGLGLAAVVVAILLAVVPAMGLFRARLARFLPGPLEAAYHRFHHGTVASFRGKVALVTLLGLLAWMAEVGRLFFVAEALGISLTLPLVIYVTLANAMLSLVPVTPGGLGVVEWGTTGLLMLSARIESETTAFSIVALDRSISWLSIIVIGFLLLMGRELLKRRGRPASPTQEALSGKG